MKYDFIAYAIIACVLSLVFAAARKEASKKGMEMSTTYFTVSLPKVYFWACVIFTALLGIVLALLFAYMIIEAIFDMFPLLLFFLGFFIALVWCCIVVTRWKIQVADDNIWVTEYNGKVEQRNVHELEIKQSTQSVQAIVNGKRFFVANFSYVGYDYLVNWLRMYQKIA